MNNFSAAAEPNSLAALHEQDARHFRIMFLGLADVGAEMVQMIAQRARDEACSPASIPTQLPELVAAYDRLMRSLRRTALLVEKFTAPAPAQDHAGPGRDGARERVIRRREDSSDRDAPVDVAKVSDAELLERLEGLEPEDDIAGHSLGDVIAAILDQLGVAALPGVARHALRTPAAAPCAGAVRPVPPQRGRAGDWPVDGAEANTMRPDGATGCRDP